jgi:hypothetical protein
MLYSEKYGTKRKLKSSKIPMLEVENFFLMILNTTLKIWGGFGNLHKAVE